MTGEQICIRLIKDNYRGHANQNNGTGTLRVGLCKHDPSLMSRPLPRYACPHLTREEGFWAKPLPQISNKENALIHFRAFNDGKFYFGIDGSPETYPCWFQ